MDRAIASRVERLEAKAQGILEEQHRELGEIREEDQEFFDRAYPLVKESLRIAEETKQPLVEPRELAHGEYLWFIALLCWSIWPQRPYPRRERYINSSTTMTHSPNHDKGGAHVRTA